jgi:hypothetical protein
MHRARIVGFINFIFLKKDAAIASETFVLLIKMSQWKFKKCNLRTHIIKLQHIMTPSTNDDGPKAWDASKKWKVCGRNRSWPTKCYYSGVY